MDTHTHTLKTLGHQHYHSTCNLWVQVFRVHEAVGAQRDVIKDANNKGDLCCVLGAYVCVK